nr:zinc finger BED domain-containing protein RICESLEEPER 2-like [Tanacetum cinerariifolium]
METQGETSNANIHIESNMVLPSMSGTATQDQTKADNASNIVMQVGRKRKLTSPCWNYFKKIQVNGEWKADCNYFYKKLAGSSRHVEEQKKADGTPSSFLSNYTLNEDTSRQNLVEMIIVHETMVLGFCGREWGEVMGSCGKGGERAGNVKDSVASLAGELGTVTVGLNHVL